MAEIINPNIYISEDASMEEMREAFSHDNYTCGTLHPELLEVRKGYARVQMKIIAEQHTNAVGGVMGGVYFTLADYAFGVAGSVGAVPPVSINASIDYLTTPRDNTLIAECRIERSGRSLCFGRIDLLDGQGKLCARMNMTGMRTGGTTRPVQ